MMLMKKTGIVVLMLMMLTVFSVCAWADCASNCDGPFQTCLNLCRQTTKPDSSQAASCADRCFHGLSGCQKKCDAKNRKSELILPEKNACAPAAADPSGRATGVTLAANCIDQGLTCILNGTPCCAPYSCKGKFPNTTCR